MYSAKKRTSAISDDLINPLNNKRPIEIQSGAFFAFMSKAKVYSPCIQTFFANSSSSVSTWSSSGTQQSTGQTEAH